VELPESHSPAELEAVPTQTPKRVAIVIRVMVQVKVILANWERNGLLATIGMLFIGQYSCSTVSFFLSD
jgi:hypothetical protein